VFCEPQFEKQCSRKWAGFHLEIKKKIKKTCPNIRKKIKNNTLRNKVAHLAKT
jgi:hypothetical protein